MKIDATNMFGCFEMDKASSKIMDKVDSFDSVVDVCYQDFMGDADALLGFIMLVGYGWLYPSYPNGMFSVDSKFLEKVKKLCNVDVTRRHLEI